MATQIRVPDADCMHCKHTIESAVSALDGVEGAHLDLEAKILEVDHNASVEKGELTGAIGAAGYTPQEVT